MYNSFANFVVLKCATVELKNQLFEYLLQQDIYVSKVNTKSNFKQQREDYDRQSKADAACINAICDFFSSIGIEEKSKANWLCLIFVVHSLIFRLQMLLLNFKKKSL